MPLRGFVCSDKGRLRVLVLEDLPWSEGGWKWQWVLSRCSVDGQTFMYWVGSVGMVVCSGALTKFINSEKLMCTAQLEFLNQVSCDKVHTDSTPFGPIFCQ